MANVTGYVQSLDILSSGTYAKAGIGPTPTDVEMLLVLAESGDDTRDLIVKGAIIDSLSTALATRREVTAFYNDGDNKISRVELNRA